MSDSKNLQEAMESLHKQATFPVPSKDYGNIGSTFMYRIEIDTKKLDFHRSIDIGGRDEDEGEAIVAAYPGKFISYCYYKGAGWTVTLRHEFSEPFYFKNKLVKSFYTWYSHLNNEETAKIVEDRFKKGESIESGQLIGKMGKSGATKVVHLDFSVRIGSRNSLQYQVNNPKVEQWDFDPHIHPMMLFEKSPAPSHLSLTPAIASNGNIEFTYQANRRQPILNRIEAKIISDNSVVKSHVIDLNLRTGIVSPAYKSPLDETWLDNLDLQKPHFVPIDFGYNADIYKTKIVIPSSWINRSMLDGTNNSIQLEATDIWGKTIDCSYKIASMNR